MENFDCMAAKFKVVDLFAGPGGLAEGFSSIRGPDNQRVFDITLSVEKEVSAHRTLRLRSFVRQFDTPPASYYDYVDGKISLAELMSAHPTEWQAAIDEARMLELGTAEAQQELDPVLDRLRMGTVPTVLIGGPPCQAYSLVGRARNKGISGYDPTKDHRHFLYREYIRIIERLQPAAFVMENVKGILSSKVGKDAIFQQIIADLEVAGGAPDSYVLLPVVRSDESGPKRFIVRCEEFGVPQCRHRVIILGVRSDLARLMPDNLKEGLLERVGRQATVEAAIKGLASLRSGLSKEPDGSVEWQRAAGAAMEMAAKACNAKELKDVRRLLLDSANELARGQQPLGRQDRSLSTPRDNELADWLVDPDLKSLPNHETRGHMRADLSRYAFATAFAQVFERSPKASEFPELLAPNHGNWQSGKFADRFRVQIWGRPSTTVTSHISKDGHYFIHPDLIQCRSLTVREAARLQTFPDNYLFEGNRTQQFVQVGNAVPPLMARQIANGLSAFLAPLVEQAEAELETC